MRQPVMAVVEGRMLETAVWSVCVCVRASCVRTCLRARANVRVCVHTCERTRIRAFRKSREL